MTNMHDKCQDQNTAAAGDRLAEQLAAVLVQLVFQAQQWGFSLQPFLAALRRLASEWPSLLTPYIPLLGACITTAGDSLDTLMSHGVSGVGFWFVFPFFCPTCTFWRPALNSHLGAPFWRPLLASPFGSPFWLPSSVSLG
jgi:hypothetical protein